MLRTLKIPLVLFSFLLASPNLLLIAGGGGSCGPSDNCGSAPSLATATVYSYDNTGCDAIADCEDCFTINDCANICSCAPCANEECNSSIMGKLCNIESAFCGSPENTSWAEFCPSVSGDHDFTVSNVSCSGGGGSLQFGLWDAGVTCGNNNQSNLLDCTGGTTTTLTFTETLVAGQCYLIFFDGNAGAGCTWDFTITAPPLAIKLQSYKVSSNAAGNSLHWAINGSGDYHSFRIIRRYDNLVRQEGDTDDEQYNKMPRRDFAFLASVAFSPENQEYQFLDEDINQPGVYIYELYQEDNSGNLRYLGVEEIFVDKPPKTRFTGIYPGQEKGVYRLEADVTEALSGELNVYSIKGEKLNHKALGKIEPGSRSFDLDLRNLPAGIYIYELNLGGKSFAGKVVKS